LWAPARPVTVSPVTPPKTPWGAALGDPVTLVFGFSAGAFLAIGTLVGGGTALPGFGTFAVCFGALAFRSGRSALPRLALRRADEHLQLGEFAEAREQLQGLSLWGADARIQRAVDYTLGQAALLGGDLPGARLALEACIRRNGLLARAADDLAVPMARGLLAFIAGAEGARTRAEAEAKAVRAHRRRTLRALGTAALGEALALWRTGDRAAATALLRRHRRHVLGFSGSALRAVARALLAATPGSPTSVYREPPRPAAGPTRSALSTWVHTVVPDLPRTELDDGAERPAPNGEPASLATAAPLTAAERSAGEVRVPFHQTARGRALMSWALLIGMFLTIWKVLEPSRGDVRPRPAPTPPSVELTWLHLAIQAPVFVFLGLLLYWKLGSESRGAGHRHDELMRAYEEGPSAVVALLEERIRRGNANVALAASYELADELLRAGQFGAARAHVESVLQRAAQQGQTAAGWTLGATLQWAVVHAAAGREPEARAALARAEQMGALRSALRAAETTVGLALALRAGRRDEAYRVAASVPPSLDLGLAEDLTCRVLAALAPGAATPAHELQQLHAELAADPNARAWQHALDPQLGPDFDAHVRAASARRESGHDPGHERLRPEHPPVSEVHHRHEHG